jgi:hypothetical protein
VAACCLQAGDRDPPAGGPGRGIGHGCSSLVATVTGLAPPPILHARDPGGKYRDGCYCQADIAGTPEKPMRKARAASGLTAAAATLSGLAFLAGCGGSQPAAQGGVASMPPNLILAEARAAAETAGSVHVVQTGRTTRETAMNVGDVSSSMGHDVMTLSDGAQATVLLTGDVAYLRANLAALTGYFLLPGTTASRMAGRWISVRSSTAGYQRLWDGLSFEMTTGSVLDADTPVGPLTKTPTRTIDGRLVVGVRGKVPAWTGAAPGTTETLYVTATGQPLPVSCQEIYRSSQVTTAFSRWGETVQVTAPPGVTPIPAASPSPSPR